MKKILAFLLALVMCLSLCACGGSNATENTTESVTEPAVDSTAEAASEPAAEPAAEPVKEPTADSMPSERSLTPEQQLVFDAVNAKIQSEEFASWENLYQEFTGSQATLDPQVTNVIHYKIQDFDDVEMDCYLVAVAANIAHWVNEEAQKGSIDGQLYIFVDANTKASFDSITTDAGNAQHDTKTELGRATYLLWIFGNRVNGSYEGNFLNDSETVTEWSADERMAVNAGLVGIADSQINPEATAEQQLIIDTVNAKIRSEEFASWENLYQEFTGSQAILDPQVTNVIHYEIQDFDGVEMDCYLVAVAANIAHWVNEEAQQGSIDGQLYIFVDVNTKASFDSITTDAGNAQHDTKTELGRATYLLWIFGNRVNGSYEGNFLNDSETVTEWSADELAVINANL